MREKKPLSKTKIISSNTGKISSKEKPLKKVAKGSTVMGLSLASKKKLKNIKKKKAAQKHFTSIFLMPSEAISTVVQFSPQLRFHSVVPATKRSITHEYYDYANPKQTNSTKMIEFESDHMLWGQMVIFENAKKPHAHYRAFCFPDAMTDITKFAKEGKLPVFTTGGSHLESGTGKICFGSLDPPRNLRHAHTRFWASSFKDSENVFKAQTVYHSKNYAKNKSYTYLQRDWLRQTFGDSYVVYRNEMSKAIFVTTDPTKMRKFPGDKIKAWDKTVTNKKSDIVPGKPLPKNQMTAVIGSATKTNDGRWLVKVSEDSDPVDMGTKINVFGSKIVTEDKFGSVEKLPYRNAWVDA